MTRLNGHLTFLHNSLLPLSQIWT